MDNDGESWEGVSNLPPFESIILNQNSGVQVLTTPIKRPSLSDDNKNLDSIIQQNNHTNTYLKIIGQKL